MAPGGSVDGVLASGPGQNTVVQEVSISWWSGNRETGIVGIRHTQGPLVTYFLQLGLTS